MSNLNIFISPEQTKLEDEYHILKDQYVQYMTEREILEQCGKPQLEAFYMVKIGQRQYELMQLQLEVKQLKRNVELSVIQLNHNRTINWIEIEKQVFSEFKAEKERIWQEANRIEQANFLLANLETAENSAELHSLYRSLAKILHPDLNPNINPQQIELWYAVQDAYQQSNLTALRSLEIITSDISDKKIILDTTFLLSKIELMREGIQKLLDQIEYITQQFPFSIEKQLKNDLWVEEQCKSINLQMQNMKMEKIKYLERLDLIKTL
jgi:hypothetical protein